MPVELLLDVLLAGALVVVAWRAVAAPTLFAGVVLYITFGLLLSLVWVRLAAPDLALAEAALGAGVTGALLLDAAGQMGEGRSSLRGRIERVGRWMSALVAAALAATLLATVVLLAPRIGGLTGVVSERMEESGVENAVTAVLLNFRGYDTWLELVVLLVAVLGILAMRRSEAVDDVEAPEVPDGIPHASTSLLVPFVLLAAGYLLWRGTREPGGAFQAGAVLGSLGILLVILGRPQRTVLGLPMFRPLLVAGVAAFLLAGIGTLALGGTLLELPRRFAGPIIIAVETAVTVSIATALVALFAGARASRARPGTVRS
jgi:multisubunit Na+/H+ antiporter MnhB subunit